MDPAFTDLRRVIYTKEGNLKRFRQLMVNAIMATDIVDKELKQQRNARWEAAFSKDGPLPEGPKGSAKEDSDRKATIVIEHLMQASDISHTMQHWRKSCLVLLPRPQFFHASSCLTDFSSSHCSDIYRKWNERFFAENVKAFKAGRSDKNPVEYWYKGELGFFDYYIIPLAKKLKECGVFGVSCDEVGADLLPK